MIPLSNRADASWLSGVWNKKTSQKISVKGRIWGLYMVVSSETSRLSPSVQVPISFSSAINKTIFVRSLSFSYFYGRGRSTFTATIKTKKYALFFKTYKKYYHSIWMLFVLYKYIIELYLVNSIRSQLINNSYSYSFLILDMNRFFYKIKFYLWRVPPITVNEY